MRARSSFYWPMRLAAGSEERSALFALHHFLRAADDAADGAAADEASLTLWRRECVLLSGGKADTEEGRNLLPYLTRFGVKTEWLAAVVEGCAMDMTGKMHCPDEKTLTRYCERVAVMPGVAVLAILGHRGAAALALAQALGHALQRTNMLRDAGDDARAGRVYFPPRSREAFMAGTEAYYQQAARVLAQMPRRNLLPVVLMRDVYRRLFHRLRRGAGAGNRAAELLWLLSRSIRYRVRGA